MRVSADLAGALLGGRYRLRQLLATGGMSSVWLADDVRLDRPVAVKLLADVLELDELFVRRFHREAQVAASLSHPNLVLVYDSGDDPRPYLVMEYVEGASLAAILHSRRGFTGDPVVLARDLLEALAYVHAHGIVHRDVKPGNVLIAADDDRARLTDFGIAQPQGAAHLTVAGEAIGTLAYMAPELRRGAPAGVRSDLYGAGAVIAECMGDHAPARLRMLVRLLTATDPARRPASATQALSVLGGDGRSTAPMRARGRAAHSALPAAIACVLVGAALLLADAPGLRPDDAGQALPARNAPVSQQLDALNRLVDHVRAEPARTSSGP